MEVYLSMNNNNFQYAIHQCIDYFNSVYLIQIKTSKIIYLGLSTRLSNHMAKSYKQLNIQNIIIHGNNIVGCIQHNYIKHSGRKF